MANLYTINSELSELLERGFDIDEETGEVIEDIAEKLATLQIAEHDKLEHVALYIKNLDSEADAIKAEEKVLAERRKAKEGHVERLKKYLTDFMLSTDKRKFETARVNLSFRKSEVVEIQDNELTWFYAEKNPEYLRQREPELNIAAIKKALKADTYFPGAVLTKRENLQIK